MGNLKAIKSDDLFTLQSRKVVQGNFIKSKKNSTLGLFSDIALKVMNGPNFVPDNL